MRINVKAKPSASEEKIEKMDEMSYVVSVKEPPVQGQANAAILRALGHYFNVAPSQLRIVSGHTSRKKVIEVLGK